MAVGDIIRIGGGDIFRKFTAAENIAAGDFVNFNASGQIKKASNLSSCTLTGILDENTTVVTAQFCQLEGGKVLVAELSASGVLGVRVISQKDGNIVAGPTSNVAQSGISGVLGIQEAGPDKAIVTFGFSNGNLNVAAIGVRSDNTVVIGSAVGIGSSNEYLGMCKLSEGAVAHFRNYTSNLTYGFYPLRINWDGVNAPTVILGTWYDMGFATSAFGACVKIATGKILAVTGANGAGVWGTVLTFDELTNAFTGKGTTVLLNVSSSYPGGPVGIGWDAANSRATVVFMRENSAASNFYARSMTISGTTITLEGAAPTIVGTTPNNGTYSATFRSFQAGPNCIIALVGKDIVRVTNASGTLTGVTLTGPLPTILIGYNTAPGAASFTPITANSFLAHNYNYQTGRYNTFLFKLDSLVQGIAPAAITSGQQGFVVLEGVSAGFTGLIPGTLYYSHPGFLTTDTLGFVAGMAISATEMKFIPEWARKGA